MRPLCILALGLVFASCGTTSSHRFGMSDLQQELDSQPPLFTDADIAELEALAPQLPVPFRLGIAPPLSLDLDPSGDWLRQSGAARRGGFGSWDAEEAAVIEEWGRRFREAGIVSEVVLLPRFLVQGTATDEPGALMPSLRQAGARHHVDAVLVVNRLSASQSHATFLSVLDLTVLGAYVVPAYEVSSMALVEAALMDTRNGYLYASARGNGADERRAPAMETEKWVSKVRARARVRALADLGEKLRVQTGFVPPLGDAR